MRTKIHNPRGVVVMFRVLLAAFMTLSFIASSSPVKAADPIPGLPDLVITNVTVTNMSGTPITEINAGQEFKVNVTVDNQGGDEYEDCVGSLDQNCVVDEVYVDVYLGPAPLTDGCDPATSVYNNTNNVDPADTDIISAEDPAKTISISVTVPNSQAGDLELYAYVDVNCSVDEDLADESNNSYPSQLFRVNAVLNSLTLRSAGARDGWILESTENSLTGGTMNSSATTITLGDDAQDRQYRAILHFDASSLPDNAVITSAILKLRRQGISGTNPFNILGALRVDARRPDFGAPTLELADFRASAAKNNIATFNVTPDSNWYSATLNSIGRAYISRTSTTQFKIFFTTGDNDDLGADIIKFYSGNAGVSSRPRLVIQYYVP